MQSMKIRSNKFDFTWQIYAQISPPQLTTKLVCVSKHTISVKSPTTWIIVFALSQACHLSSKYWSGPWQWKAAHTSLLDGSVKELVFQIGTDERWIGNTNRPWDSTEYGLNLRVKRLCPKAYYFRRFRLPWDSLWKKGLSSFRNSYCFRKPLYNLLFSTCHRLRLTYILAWVKKSLWQVFPTHKKAQYTNCGRSYVFFFFICKKRVFWICILTMNFQHNFSSPCSESE